MELSTNFEFKFEDFFVVALEGIIFFMPSEIKFFRGFYEVDTGCGLPHFFNISCAARPLSSAVRRQICTSQNDRVRVPEWDKRRVSISKGSISRRQSGGSGEPAFTDNFQLRTNLDLPAGRY